MTDFEKIKKKANKRFHTLNAVLVLCMVSVCDISDRGTVRDIHVEPTAAFTYCNCRVISQSSQVI